MALKPTLVPVVPNFPAVKSSALPSHELYSSNRTFSS